METFNYSATQRVGMRVSFLELSLIFLQGAIELSLICARVFDSDNAGFDYWRSGASSDSPARAAYERRLQCYELILDSLSVFEHQMNDPSAAGISLTPQELESVKDLAYKLSFSSDDEMFHSTLYDWLISRQLADDLLEVCALSITRCRAQI